MSRKLVKDAGVGKDAMKTKEEILSQPQPERVCTRCGQASTRYTVTSMDAKCVECADCLRKREELDQVLKARMMNNEGSQSFRPRKKPLQFEWVPSYD